MLGDFRDAVFEEGGKRTRFFMRGERYCVETEGPDGRPQEYEIAYAFGWFPLQQYLIAFPGGRLQCLMVGWDVPGKRWFSLHPGQAIPPSDWLHWTRPASNWNTMCATCHSTAVQKRYDPAVRTYRTTWSEIAVGCEACHGPGSLHNAWARKPAMARPPLPNAALPVSTSGMGPKALIDLCMPCHSRRADLRDPGLPGAEPLDTLLPVTLAEGLYYPDGQIQDEVFEYQSFLQSKMHQRGVKCSDCHDVHSGARHKEGNALCLQCHRPDAYDTPAHHFHKPVVEGKPGPGAQCAACHMPGRNYMVVHFRRDHGMRIPRPDLSAEIGVPNACTAKGCHDDKPLRWSVEAYDHWYGKTRKPHFGTVLAAGRRGGPEARGPLTVLAGDRLSPAIVRATALDLLWQYPAGDTEAVLQTALTDADPLVRRTAASRLETADASGFVRALTPLLKDPVAAVRTGAASRLAALPPEALPEPYRAPFNAALEELKEQLAYTADMPSGRYNWALLEQDLGHAEEAERQYREALALDGHFILAKSNLALLLAGQEDTAGAERLLREVLKDRPGEPAAAFNLGLLLAGAGRPEEAEPLLRTAADHPPTTAQAAYNLAVLVSRERPAEAVAWSRKAAEAAPGEPKYAFTLAYFQAAAGDLAGAEATLTEGLRLHPAHGDSILLLGDLLVRSGRPDEARTLYERALTDPRLSAEAGRAIAARSGRAPAP
jgi:Flp pilus assembly protein TadD